MSLRSIFFADRSQFFVGSAPTKSGQFGILTTFFGGTTLATMYGGDRVLKGALRAEKGRPLSRGGSVANRGEGLPRRAGPGQRVAVLPEQREHRLSRQL